MTTDAQRDEWRRGFEKLGPITLRASLQRNSAGMPNEYLREAERWLLEQEAKAANSRGTPSHSPTMD
jgi:hypothetical protein